MESTVDAKTLERRRIRLGYSQSQLASAMGISQQAVSLYEREKRDIPEMFDMAMCWIEFTKGVLSDEVRAGIQEAQSTRRIKVDIPGLGEGELVVQLPPDLIDRIENATGLTVKPEHKQTPNNGTKKSRS